MGYTYILSSIYATCKMAAPRSKERKERPLFSLGGDLAGFLYRLILLDHHRFHRTRPQRLWKPVGPAEEKQCRADSIALGVFSKPLQISSLPPTSRTAAMSIVLGVLGLPPQSFGCSGTTFPPANGENLSTGPDTRILFRRLTTGRMTTEYATRSGAGGQTYNVRIASSTR
jgi:hypothetical protein